MVTIEENDGWQSFCSFCLSIKANKDSKNLDSQCIVCKNTFIFQKIKDSCYCVEKEKRKFPYFGKYCGVREMPPNFGVRSKLIFEPTKGKIGKTDNNLISKLLNYDVGTLESDATNKKLGEDVYFTKQHGIPNEERKNYPSQSTMMESNSYYHPKSCSEPKLFMSSSSGLFFGKSSSSEFSIKPVFTKGNRMKNLKRIHRNQNFRLYEGYPRYLNQSSFEYTRFISFNEKFLENKGIGTKNPKKKSVMARKDKLISGRSKHSLPPRSRKTTRKKVTDKIRYPNNCVTEIYLKSKYPGGDIKIFIEGKSFFQPNDPRGILHCILSSSEETRCRKTNQQRLDIIESGVMGKCCFFQASS